MSKIARLQEQLQKLISTFNILKYQVPTRLLPNVQLKAEKLIAVMHTQGFDVVINQGFRSIDEQNYLYAQGRTRPGAIVTNAKGGESFHNYGVAVDIVFLKDGHPSWNEEHPWARLGREGKALGFEWGGDWVSFVDRPHFQLTNGHTLEEFQNKKVDYSLIK